MNITLSELKKIIQEELEKSGAYGSGMEKAKVDKEKAELVGHTWLTHAKLGSPALEESCKIQKDAIGKVMQHSLKKDGTISHYDIKFGNKLIKNIPAKLVESVKEQNHAHETKDR